MNSEFVEQMLGEARGCSPSSQGATELCAAGRKQELFQGGLTSKTMHEAGSGEDVTVDFPEDLLEKIILGMPFPYIFTARVLSKEWNAKFETMVRSLVNEWPSFCPAFFDTERNLFLGYDRSGGKWLKTSLNPVQRTLKSLRSAETAAEFRPNTPCEVNGVLFCEVDGVDSTIRVINLLTGRTRTIPYPPCLHEGNWNTEHCSFYWSIIVPLEAQKYQVVLYGIVKDREGHYMLQRHVFDSGLMSWSSRSLPAYFDCYCKFCAYLDGRMYYTCSMSGVWDSVVPRLGSVRFGDQHSTIFQREIPLGIERDSLHGLVRCGSRIIFFVVTEEENRAVVHLYDVHTRTLSLSQLSVGLLQGFTGGASTAISPRNVIAHRNSIFFYGLSSLHSYDLESDVWSTHRIEFLEEYRKVLHIVQLTSGICSRPQCLNTHFCFYDQCSAPQ